MALESIDGAILPLIESIHDWLEDRYGRRVAWTVTITLSLAILGSLGAVLWYFLR